MLWVSESKGVGCACTKDVDALLEAALKKNAASETEPENGPLKESENGSDSRKRRRSKSRSRSRSRDRHRRKSGSRDRRHRSRSRDRRRRSRSRDRRRRSSSRSRRHRRSRSRSGGRRKRHPSSSRERRKAQNEEEEKKEDPYANLPPRERERLEIERDERTVFAANIHIRATEEDVKKFFEEAGPVNMITFIKDRRSRKHKGIAYVEMAEKRSIPLALQLSGQPLMNQAVLVTETQAEKNRAAGTMTIDTGPSGPTRLYVGSLHYNTTEQELERIFSRYGSLDFVNMHTDNDTGRSKGYAFVQFKRADDAKRALSKAKGMELHGRPLKVGLVNESSQQGFLGELDDEDSGVAMNAQSRAILMQKLQHSAGPSFTPIMAPSQVEMVEQLVPGPIGPSGVRTMVKAMVPNMDLPTPCLVLKNMFDPTTEEDPNFDQEIKEDVVDECSNFGAVKHCYVDKYSHGYVYLKFDTPHSANKAKQALDKRWFAGKMISAESMPIQAYHARFPEAA